MKFCISVIHLGRYKIEMLDDHTYQIISGYDCGSAGIMVALTKWIFEAEHRQYQADQKANSDAITAKVLADMRDHPENYVDVPKGQKVIGPK